MPRSSVPLVFDLKSAPPIPIGAQWQLGYDPSNRERPYRLVCELGAADVNLEALIASGQAQVAAAASTPDAASPTPLRLVR